jgi:DNA-binding NarL/FixJ family response regulator
MTWDAGFDGHLSKPVSAQALDQVVDRVMRRSATLPETPN